jgi:hypothetical protein
VSAALLSRRAQDLRLAEIGRIEWMSAGTRGNCLPASAPMPCQVDVDRRRINQERRIMVSTKKKPSKRLAVSKRTREKGPAPRTGRQQRPQRPKKLGALNAAAKVLAEMGTPMTTGEMIEAMAAKGLWTSPHGRTPAATLYSAILKELKTKGEASRFVKTERGKFGALVKTVQG